MWRTLEQVPGELLVARFLHAAAQRALLLFQQLQKTHNKLKLNIKTFWHSINSINNIK
jgi:hypothetical protein